MAAPVFTRCAKPLADLVEQTGVDLADVEAVELLGGGTRIPGVVAALSAALGGRTPDRCATGTLFPVVG
jgi:hypoxia up-regulated 1